MTFSFFYISFYFWLHWVFVAACGLSLVVPNRGCSSLQCTACGIFLDQAGVEPRSPALAGGFLTTREVRPHDIFKWFRELEDSSLCTQIYLLPHSGVSPTKNKHRSFLQPFKPRRLLPPKSLLQAKNLAISEVPHMLYRLLKAQPASGPFKALTPKLSPGPPVGLHRAACDRADSKHQSSSFPVAPSPHPTPPASLQEEGGQEVESRGQDQGRVQPLGVSQLILTLTRAPAGPAGAG